MTPAQRRKKIAKFKKSNNKKGPSLGKFLWPFLILLMPLVYVWATSRIFAKNPKLTVVVAGESRVFISTFDRESGSIYNLEIPPNTHVDVARQLGTWPAEGVWRLGENEKLGGTLLAETIIKNFKIPVLAWADENFLRLAASKTDLGVGDRVRLALFSLGVSPAKRININLADYGFLKPTRLAGGEEGFTIGSSLPQSLYYVFAEEKINSAGLRIEVQNYAGGKKGAETMASVLEVLGGKAAALTTKPSEDFFCEVRGNDREVSQKIARIFDCKVTGAPENNFDVTIRLGEEFAKRF